MNYRADSGDSGARKGTSETEFIRRLLTPVGHGKGDPDFQSQITSTRPVAFGLLVLVDPYMLIGPLPHLSVSKAVQYLNFPTSVAERATPVRDENNKRRS